MQWEKLLNYNRLNEHEREFDEARNPFSIDFDRIIFSDSFRRLDRKTQVHPMRSNDNVHSRLPHSLEVSCVGRSLGTLVGAQIKDLPAHMNPDRVGQIVQAACLAHDIGNPPFGHMGETIIGSWFEEHGAKYFDAVKPELQSDFIHFEGNAQAFRIMTRLAMYRDNGGLRPTYAVIAAMMKYPWIYQENIKKFCCFSSEREILDDIAAKAGLEGADGMYKRHPLAYLSEAADDICYSIIDLEDAYEMGILRFTEVKEILNAICELPEQKLEGKSPKESMEYMRAIAINKCVGAVVNEFFANYEAIMDGTLHYKHNLLENSAYKEPISQAKKTGNDVIYQNRRKLMLEVGAYNVMGILLETFCDAAFEYVSADKPKDKTQHIIKIMGDHAPSKKDDVFTALHRVTDYISGMTDNYATEKARQITGI
ncbi:deoxyguanosinetriphosphate triphosphohydrolase [Seleniivibrio woodruffii]|uniref:deoxyguanosinetriphosphate triphosphohydrolase n=1 Tax=Seleniivibrio woodruffii TaxID=1078050 RepID=UPI0026F100C9|nr:deoxyguanosinetriphosphate triphosphohydrolase [Seleniivibrio woodruffii]